MRIRGPAGKVTRAEHFPLQRKRICATFPASGSGNNVVNDVAGDIGEAEVAAGVAVSELFVIQTHEVQDSGVEVMHVDGVLGVMHAEVDAHANACSAIDATT